MSVDKSVVIDGALLAVALSPWALYTAVWGESTSVV